MLNRCRIQLTDYHYNIFFRRMWNISAGNKLYRKEFLLNNDLTFQEGLLHEDVLWTYKIASMAKKLFG